MKFDPNHARSSMYELVRPLNVDRGDACEAADTQLIGPTHTLAQRNQLSSQTWRSSSARRAAREVNQNLAHVSELLDPQ